MSDAPAGPEVLYDVDGHVATITLNRPHRRNAISVRMLVRARRDPRASSATAACGARSSPAPGQGFCSGLDIKDAMAGTGIGGGGSLGGSAATGPSLARTSDLPTVTLHEMNTPVIAAINGAAAGATASTSRSGATCASPRRRRSCSPASRSGRSSPRAAARGTCRGSSAGRRRPRSPTSGATSPPRRPRATAS